MKILNQKLQRKDPLNPIIGSKGKQYQFKLLSNNKQTYDLGSSNQNSSFIKNTFNNSTNRISSTRQTSNLSDIINENKKTCYTNNNITISSDILFACLNKNPNKVQYSKSKPKKKKVRFVNSEKFVEIILVESHKNFHKLDDFNFDENQKDIDKLKVKKSEIINKEKNNNNKTINSKKKDASPIKVKELKAKENKKEMCKNNKNFASKAYDDRACKCIIF